jgi:hypothetical protein
MSIEFEGDGSLRTVVYAFTTFETRAVPRSSGLRGSLNEVRPRRRCLYAATRALYSVRQP